MHDDDRRSSRFDASSFGISIFFAILGYVSTAVQQIRVQQHNARVQRVSEQLKNLYGPLLACVTASKWSYDAMIKQAARDSGKPSLTIPQFAVEVRSNPQGVAARAYRSWVKSVLLPLSERAAQLVIDRADLLENSGIEPLLLQLVAHVSAYKVIIQRWKEGGDEAMSAIPYPDDIIEFANEGFAKLKRRQARLLGIAADGSQGSPLMQLIASKL